MQQIFKVEEMSPLVEIQPKAGSSNQDPLKKIEMNLTDGINTVRAEAFGRVAERIANLVKDCKNQEYVGLLATVDYTLERREGKTREDGSKTYFMSFRMNEFAFIQELVKTF
jgi:hypothetical protein